ncbi:MAG: SIMPL domain-containing protein, partial [Bacteroidales bacterium]
IFFLLITALFISYSAQSQEQTAVQNYIEVSTRAEKQITPDEIYLSITISETESKGKISLEKQEADMLKALKGININVETNLTVKDMASDLQTYFLRKNNILASKSYVLKVSTAEKAAAALSALNSIKISEVSLEKTAISPALEKQTKNELLTEAAQQAKENAEILATAVGSKADIAIYIQNYYSFQPYSNFSLKSARTITIMDGENAYENAPALEISKTSVSVNVLCRFAIKPQFISK